MDENCNSRKNVYISELNNNDTLVIRSYILYIKISIAIKTKYITEKCNDNKKIFTITVFFFVISSFYIV